MRGQNYSTLINVEMNKRRLFLKNMVRGTASYGLVSMGVLNACSPKQGSEEITDENVTAVVNAKPELFFEISLAQWSLHKTLFDGNLDNLDFASFTQETFGINAVEYVNQFFKDKAKDQDYLSQMKTRTDDLGMTNVLIMVDGEGHLGGANNAERMKAVENHYQWVEAAKFLGCHSIRVNAAGEGSAEEVAAAAVDGLGKLTTFANDHNIGVIVENHGGYSSDGMWLSGVISQVNMPGCGTLPDFGNFCVEREKTDDGYTCTKEYDRYKGTSELMPFAKGVSAKANNFDAAGDCTETDYRKMLTIVKEAGYKGFIGIEYEGASMSEVEGIQATKDLLTKVGHEIS